MCTASKPVERYRLKRYSQFVQSCGRINIYVEYLSSSVYRLQKYSSPFKLPRSFRIAHAQLEGICTVGKLAGVCGGITGMAGVVNCVYSRQAIRHRVNASMGRLASCKFISRQSLYLEKLLPEH